MKFLKLLSIFILLMVSVATAAAYNVNINWQFNKAGYDVELYHCLDSQCTNVGTKVIDTYSPNPNYYMSYSTSGSQKYAAYFFKEAYRARGYIIWSTGSFTTTFSDSFSKKDYCESAIDALGVSDTNPTQGDTITASTNIHSAFSEFADDPGTPDYEPTSHSDWFTSDITVNLDIKQGSTTVMSLTPKLKSIYEDQSAGVSFNIDTTSLSPGTYTVELSTDPTDSICNQDNKIIKIKTSTIIIEAANTAPTINVPDQNIDEDSGLNDNLIDLWDYASDAESSDSDLTFTITDQTDISIVNCEIDSNRYIDCTTEDDQYGSSEITVEVEDPEGLTDTDTFTIEVEEYVNQAPVIEGIPDIYVFENSDLNEDILNLEDYASDDQDDVNDLIYTITIETDTTIVDCEIDTENNLDCTAKDDQYGSSEITVQAEDLEGLTDTETFTVYVSKVNESPEVSTIPGQTVEECDDFETFDLDDYVSDADNTDEEITWTITGNTDLTIAVDGENIVTITYTCGFVGSETLTFTADDGTDDDSTTATFTVEEESENTAPEIDDIPNKKLDKNSGENEHIIDLWDYASDEEDDDDELDYEIIDETNKDAVDCSIDDNRYIDCEVMDDEVGYSYITIRVEDSEGLTDTDKFKVTIEDDNEDDKDDNEGSEGSLTILSVSHEEKVKAGESMHINVYVYGDDTDVKTTVYIDDLGIMQTFNKLTGIHIEIPADAESGKYEFLIKVRNKNNYIDSTYREITVVGKEKNDDSNGGSSTIVTGAATTATHNEQSSFYMQGLKGIITGLFFLFLILVVFLVILRLKAR